MVTRLIGLFIHSETLSTAIDLQMIWQTSTRIKRDKHFNYYGHDDFFLYPEHETQQLINRKLIANRKGPIVD